MAYFRLVQGVTRPTSYPVASGITLQRGQVLFKLTDGSVTNVGVTGATIAGIADDDKALSLNDVFIGSYTLTAETASDSSLATQNIATGLLNFAEDIASALISVACPSWSLEYKLAGAASYTKAANANVTVSLTKATGILTVAVAAAEGLEADTSYDFRLNISANIVKSQSGAFGASDMFNNDSTFASGLATTWFLEGLYETDQYDPYQVYTVNAPLYVVQATGILTTSTAGVAADAAGNIVVGYVDKAPSATFTAETRVVNGHSTPKPEALRFKYIAPNSILA